jgi:hypothetical protein
VTPTVSDVAPPPPPAPVVACVAVPVSAIVAFPQAMSAVLSVR